ncbi:hypothetical protein V5E97_06715 [Singulisphaera sp. Ch08]|uniref:Tail assembly chaperone n=1 Tax=Singulisphaera sp. Ch08 TaxID=3120278 RepID=A0AAU7CKC7_9BACT
MNSITSLIPRPRPVTIAKAGLTFQVSEFTLNDLADLQAILDSQWVDPLVAIESELEATQGDDRRKLLVAAYETAETGPPIYGEPSGRPFYESLEGVAAFFWVALRKNRPGLTPVDAAKFAMLASTSEHMQIWRIAHGSQTLKSLERMLGLGVAKRPSPEMTWGKLIEDVIESHPGWTYANVYGLTVSEFMNARRRGQPEETGIPIAMNADAIARAIKEQRERFYGKSEGSK